MAILDGLEKKGLKLIASADVSGKYRVKRSTSQTSYYSTASSQQPVDLDTWYFAEI